MSFVLIASTLSLGAVAALALRHYSLSLDDSRETDSIATDPGLLKKHSINKSYKAAGFTYTSVRTFYHPHAQASKLPTKPTPLPLLVFIHGLGGSVANYAPLLTSLVNVAPCLAIDLPGCGTSTFQPKQWNAYRIESLAQLIAEAVRQYVDSENYQKVILVGHSLGCSIAALLASSQSPLYGEIGNLIVGVVALCPHVEAFSQSQKRILSWVSWIPVLLVDLYRHYDRRGGLESASVNRYVGKDADEETKRLQLRFNGQSKTPVFLRMLSGLVPGHTVNDHPGFPGQKIWSGITIPIFSIVAELDHGDPLRQVELLTKWLGGHSSGEVGGSEEQTSIPIAAGDIPIPESKPEGNQSSSPARIEETTAAIPDMRPSNLSPPDPSSPPPPQFTLKTAVIPAPAAHGLIYQIPCVRIISGLIQSFLSTQIDHRLSLGWQLQHLTVEGKWDVKNLEKWKLVRPVSPVIGGVFRAIKTLREVDEEHTPKEFVKDWGVGGRKLPQKTDLGVINSDNDNDAAPIRIVVDISHESPVYDPKGLEEAGIEYHKFPTVSKLPPTAHEVRAFIALVDTLREHMKAGVIAVHCHYGFNRTGFFIVSYLIEHLGYTLQGALDLFAAKRPPGIRHEHFVNDLYVRYAVRSTKKDTSDI